MSKISQIKAFLFQIAPKAIQEKILSYAENKKYKHWEECHQVKVSSDSVDDLFARMDLDCDLMIHSSLLDIGNIKLRDVTSNLKKYILDRGHTILCPALPIKGSSLEYLRSIKEFDVRTAPNAMGAISSYYGRQSESRRSLSPTHSVVALGPGAASYTQEHHLDETPFTQNSPYFKLIVNKGKILMLGASLKNLTFVHVIEDMIGETCFPVQVYDSHRFTIDLINEAGERTSRAFRAHSRKSGRMRDLSELMQIVRKLPSTRFFKLGCGEVVLLDAKDVCLCLLTQLESGLTTMGHMRISDDCRQKADMWIDIINKI